MRALRYARQWLTAAVLRHQVKRHRRQRGLSTDLRSVIAVCRNDFPGCGDALERLFYPRYERRSGNV